MWKVDGLAFDAKAYLAVREGARAGGRKSGAPRTQRREHVDALITELFVEYRRREPDRTNTHVVKYCLVPELRKRGITLARKTLLNRLSKLGLR